MAVCAQVRDPVAWIHARRAEGADPTINAEGSPVITLCIWERELEAKPDPELEPEAHLVDSGLKRGGLIASNDWLHAVLRLLVPHWSSRTGFRSGFACNKGAALLMV